MNYLIRSSYLSTNTLKEMSLIHHYVVPERVGIAGVRVSS